MRHVSFRVLFAAMTCVAVVSSASGDALESLFSPGEISKAHAKYEHECKECHGKFEGGGIQVKLCLGCHDHKDVAADVKSGKGFHGRLKKQGKITCKQCHREHRGRKTPLVFINKGAFNHEMTDFRLKGAHATQNCASCHKQGKRYREADAKCYSCHKKKDVHKGKLGRKCEKCHVETGWKKSGFDHDKDTKFPLVGTHKKVDCQLCHAGNRYKKTPKACVSCHSLNDAHGRRYGEKCQTCHTPRKWKKVKFNHDRDTKYKLVGNHAKVKCDQCHSKNLYKQKLKKNCYSCHKNDDDHKGRNGKKCQACHNPRSWGKSKFDHDKKTDFPLRGKHRKLQCDACHKGAVEDELDTACYSCHKHSDAHKGKMSKKCGQCHNEEGWTKKVFFEHDITRFPLIGIHAVTPCEECHESTSYRDAPMKCFACHEKKDKHKGRFGDRCDICHNPNSWKTWLFDHNEQTDFKLDGAHKDLRCESCHRKKSGTAKIAKNCHSCHFVDDIHRGGFGRRCERCHNTKDFSEVNMRSR